MAEERTPREEMMAAVLESDLQKKTAEFQEGGTDITTLMPANEEVPAPVRPETVSEEDWGAMTDEAKGEAASAAAGGEQEPEPKVETPPAKLHKIKVDGQEQDVDEAKVIEAGIRALQKDRAADRRLQEAEDLRREAEQMKTEILGQRPPTGGAAPQAGELDEKALAHAIQYGSADEAAEALKKLRSNGGLTPEQVAFMVDERTTFREAVGYYKSEFKDIAENQDLHKLFLVKEREARQAGDTRPYRELYESIGTGMRSWLQTLTPKAADPLEAKREQKRNATPLPQSAAARQPAPQDTKEPTPAELVERMRKDRHQA